MGQPVRFVVSWGNLPEGFCPKTWQDAANTLFALLAVTPNQAYATFVTGSQAPTSNEGPWLKDGIEWFVWSDSVGGYVPITIIGLYQNIQSFATDGTFVVPDNIYSIRVEAWGAGGGGANEFGGSSESGGGAGGYGFIQKAVTPGQSIPYTVGVGGLGGAAGADGSDTVILGMTCGGGKGAVVNPNPKGGAGGTVTGADISIVGGAGKLTISGGGEAMAATVPRAAPVVWWMSRWERSRMAFYPAAVERVEPLETTLGATGRAGESSFHTKKYGWKSIRARHQRIFWATGRSRTELHVGARRACESGRGGSGCRGGKSGLQ